MKSENQIREQQEDEIMRRMLLWLGGAVILEAFVLLVNRFYFHYRTTEINFMLKLYNAFAVLPYVGVAIGIVLILWAVSARKKEPKTGEIRIILGALAVVAGVFCFLFRAAGSPSAKLLEGVVPALAILIMIYFLYQREFFAISVISGFGILGLWICRIGGGGHQILQYGYAAVVLVILIVGAAFTIKLRKTDGILPLGKKNVKIFPEDAAYTAILISCAVVAVVLLAAAVIGTAFAYYAIWGMIAWIFILAVYFTARLM